MNNVSVIYIILYYKISYQMTISGQQVFLPAGRMLWQLFVIPCLPISSVLQDGLLSFNCNNVISDVTILCYHRNNNFIFTNV